MGSTLEIIKQGTGEGIVNPLQLKVDLLSRMEEMPRGFLGKLWLRLDYSDLRAKLGVVFEDEAYAQDKLLTSHLTEFAAWAPQQGQLELTTQNRKLQEDVTVLQAQIKQLETDNKALKEENAEQLKQLQAMREQNLKLTVEIQTIAEKNHRLAERLQSNLSKIRGLEAENAQLKGQSKLENHHPNKVAIPKLKA